MLSVAATGSINSDMIRPQSDIMDVDDAMETLRARLPESSELIGESGSMQRLRAMIAMAAPTHGRVLVTGESGTGKEMFAQAIHQSSPRRKKPFKAINCAALSPTLLESELFGHKKGSFTNADSDRAGAFEAADGGL